MRGTSARMLAMTVAGLAVVGVGAGASFIGSAVASEHITTGTLALTISSPDGADSSHHTVTWSLHGAGSAIVQRHIVTLTNHGSLPLRLTTARFTDAGSDSRLALDVRGDFDGNVGTLAHIEARTYRCIATCVPGRVSASHSSTPARSRTTPRGRPSIRP